MKSEGRLFGRKEASKDKEMAEDGRYGIKTKV